MAPLRRKVTSIELFISDEPLGTRPDGLVDILQRNIPTPEASRSQ